MKNLGRMGNSEAEIMKILWESGRAMTAPEICGELEDKFSWSRSTILTLIRRLVEKGFAACEKKDLFYYSPLVTEEDYRQYHTAHLIDKLYDGSAKNLISALCRANSLSKKELEELQEFFEREAKRND